MTKPNLRKDSKCPWCGSELYIYEKDDNFACSNKECVIYNGYNNYLKDVWDKYYEAFSSYFKYRRNE